MGITDESQQGLCPAERPGDGPGPGDGPLGDKVAKAMPNGRTGTRLMFNLFTRINESRKGQEKMAPGRGFGTGKSLAQALLEVAAATWGRYPP